MPTMYHFKFLLCLGTVRLVLGQFETPAESPCGDYMDSLNNQGCDYSRFEEPRSERKIVEIVERAYHNHERVKVIGSGHSWSGIASPDGAIVMNLDNYNDTLSTGGDNIYVSFQAGIKLDDMCHRLDAMGRTLRNVPLILAGSLAGTISTGSGGTGPFGSISTYVRSMRMVLANGTIITVSRGDSLFSASAVGLGVLGVISTVTLETVPAFNLKKTLAIVPWSEIPITIDSVELEPDSFYGISLWDDYAARQGKQFGDIEWLMETFTVTNEPVSPNGGCWTRYDEDCVDKNYLAVSKDSSDLLFFENNGFKTSAEAHLSVEHAVDFYSDLSARMEALYEQGYADNKQSTFLYLLRFVEADDLDMSTSYGRDTLRADLGILTPEAITFTKYYEAFADIANLYQSRWHWGKANGLSSSRVAVSVPKFEEFSLLRNELDERCVFMNYYTESLFGSC